MWDLYTAVIDTVLKYLIELLIFRLLYYSHSKSYFCYCVIFDFPNFVLKICIISTKLDHLTPKILFKFMYIGQWMFALFI